VFMITSLTLGYFAGHKPSASIFDSRTPAVEPRPASKPVPSVQGQTAPATGPEKAPIPAAPQETQSPK
jgi:hypothetical protein